MVEVILEVAVKIRIEKLPEGVYLPTSEDRIVTQGVALRDRVVGFKQWKETGYGAQAVQMLAAFGNELDEAWLIPELEREDSLDAFRALQSLAESGGSLTVGVLNTLLEDLWRRGPRP